MKTHSLYLKGDWHLSDKTCPITNPATGEVFARLSVIDRPRVAEAIGDASDAFQTWRLLPGKQRGEFLQKIAHEVEKRNDEIARIITVENGKPLAQGQAEVAMTVEHLRWFAEEARRAYGRVIPNALSDKRHFTLKSPVGVVGAISPWNFPLVLAVRKVAPALAAGCTVILKPARQTPLACVAFAECVAAAQLPAGAFQLIAGSASEIGAEFLNNPLCRKISFTGSTEVGKLLIRGAAEQVKALSLELGGQAPAIVFADADLGRAVDGVMLAKFRNTGQSCIAANRIYVERPVYAEFLARLVLKTQELKVGNGLEPNVDVGPLIDEESLKKALSHVDDAVHRGARLLCGGQRIGTLPGYFMQPAVLADVPKEGLCMQEETFAPIAPVCSFDTEEEVILEANRPPYGLSSYVFTRDLARMFRVVEKLETGMVGVNDGLPTATHAPFGGVKQSGWGRELGSEGLEAYLETKHVSINLA